MTFPADYKQLLSQTVALGAGESRVILSPHFAPEKRYRLSITETSGLGRALITVDMLYSQNEQQIQFQVSPNGGTSIELSGTLDVNISEIMPSIDLIDFTENPVALGAAYVDLGSNGGFKQPFYNYAAVYLTAAADVALADLAGGIIWQAIGIGTGAPVLNQLRIGANQRLQARGVGVLATVVWYNRR